jgi:hypothetical protein
LFCQLPGLEIIRIGDVSERASPTSTFANGPLGLAILVDEFDAGSF